MNPVRLVRNEDIQEHVKALLNQVLPRLAALAPRADVHHIGATAIPGALTKGDVDVFVRVAREDFADTVAALGSKFEIRQRENWTPDFASFGEDQRYGLPLGVQVAVRGGTADFLIYLRDHLRDRPEELRRYNELKQAHAARGARGYWEAKDVFLTEILARRGTAPAAPGLQLGEHQFDAVNAAPGTLPASDDHDVVKILQFVHARATAAGLNEVEYRPPAPSRRKRDFLVISAGLFVLIFTILGVEAFVAVGTQVMAAQMPEQFWPMFTAVLFHSPILAWGLAGFLVLTLCIAWLMFGVMDPY